MDAFPADSVPLDGLAPARFSAATPAVSAAAAGRRRPRPPREPRRLRPVLVREVPLAPPASPAPVTRASPEPSWALPPWPPPWPRVPPAPAGATADRGVAASAGVSTGRSVVASDIEFPFETSHEARSRACTARSASGSTRRWGRGSSRTPSRSIHCCVLQALTRVRVPPSAVGGVTDDSPSTSS